MPNTLLQSCQTFRDERAVSLCPTSLTSDWRQFLTWVERCPVQDLERGREALTWVLRQEPHKSALRVAMYLRSFYRWASSEDVALVRQNPVASFKMPKAPQRDDEISVIPRSELPLVFAALERQDKTLPQWDLWARFMVQTGLRTGEVRAVCRQDISDNKLLVHANVTLTHGLKTSTKTNKRRWVPLNSVARGILESLPPDADGFLFPWARSAFQSFFSDHMQVLHKAGAISKRYRPYDLRHTAISSWLEAGVPVTQCASWAGNTAEIIWRYYASTTNTYEMPVL